MHGSGEGRRHHEGTDTGTTEGDAALVRAALDGDQDALSELVSRHLPLARAIALGAIGEPAEADDAVQDALVKAVTRLRQLREPEHFRRWLVAITVNEVRQRMRARRRRGEVPLDMLVAEPVDDADPGELVTAGTDDRARRHVGAAARWLSPREHGLMALRQLELSGRLERGDVARLSGLSSAHVAVSVHRLQVRLRELVEVCAALDEGRACPAWRRLVEGWDGTPSSVWRKRFVRHVHECPSCAAAASRVELRRLLATTAPAAVPAVTAAAVLAAVKSAGLGSAPLVATSATSALGSALLRPRVLAAGLVVAGAGALVILDPWSAPLQPPEPGARPSATTPASTPTLAQTSRPAARAATSSPSATPTPGPVLVVAPWGDDRAAGTPSAPLATVGRALAVVRAGQTIEIRGGVYRPTRPLVATSRTAGGGRVVLRAAAGEEVVLDGRDLAAGSRALMDLSVRGWQVSGLTVRRSPGVGVLCTSCSGVRFAGLDVHDNGATGLVLSGAGTTGNTVADSDFHLNHDLATKGENSDGLELRDGAGAGNAVQRCRFFDNADDGLSLWNFASPVTVDSSWAWGNGVDRWGVGAGWKGNGVGFKLGGGTPAPAAAHRVVNSAAWANRAQGFSSNRNPAALQIGRCTAYRNGQQGFWASGAGSVVERDVSVGDRTPVRAGDGVVVRGNSWQGSRPDTTRFRSTSDAVAAGPRPASGGLPVSGFLVPTLTHAGASMTGLPFD